MPLTLRNSTKRCLFHLRRLAAYFFLGQPIAKLARRYFERGETYKALSLYKIAAKLPLDSGWPLVKMADLISDPGHKLRLFKRAIRIDNHSWAYTGAIKILLSQNRLTEAGFLFQKLKRHLPETVWKNCDLTLQEVDRVEKDLNYARKINVYNLTRKNCEEGTHSNAYNCNSQMKIIYVKPTQGLGNRLLLLDSIYAFAEVHQFDKIKICWTKSKGFSEEKFEELFDLEKLPQNISFIDEPTYESLAHNRTKLEDHFFQDKDTLEYRFNTNKETLLTLISSSTFFFESWASIDWVFGIELSNRNKFIRNHIKPSAKIEEKIDSLKINHATVGIHIRKGDAFRSSKSSLYKESKEEAFHSIAETSKHPLFLATDCERTHSEFVERYKDKIIVNSHKRFVNKDLTENDPKGFQFDAVVDLFCLSKTRKIFGTNWSTFSQVAHILGSNQLEIISKDSPSSFSIPNLSAIVGVKNRASILKVSIHSWLLKREIKELIIVDCSSDDLDARDFESLDNRIKVVRLNNREHFNLSEVLNVGIQHCKHEHIIKLDVDYILNPYTDLWDWLTINWDSQFLTGDWKLESLDNSLGFLGYLNGFLCVKKQYLIEAGCYRGNQFGYGYEDCDLYSRLEKLGLKRKIINFSKNHIPVIHTPHGDYHRTAYCQEKDWEESLEKNRLAVESNSEF
jgi:tetratricopeptide (TPR) repeat protein